jgi:hypothetical protein
MAAKSLKMVEEKDAGAMLVRVYEVHGLVIETLKSKSAPEGAQFLPAKVSDQNGVILWQYSKGRFRGAFAWLLEVNGEYVVAYASKTEVFEAISIKDLPHLRVVLDAKGKEVYEGGRGIVGAIELKRAVAEQMKRKLVYTDAEQMILRVIKKREDEALAAERKAAAEQAATERSAREREKQERVGKIMARPRLVAYDEKGSRLSGVPVVGKEYEMLSDGTHVIVVERIDEDGKGVDPGEYFVVNKTAGGRISRANARLVSLNDPTKPKAVAVSRGQMVFDLKGDLKVVSLYSRSDIDALHGSGLNGATTVALATPDDAGNFTLFEIVKKGPKEIGKFQPLAV